MKQNRPETPICQDTVILFDYKMYKLTYKLFIKTGIWDAVDVNLFPG